MSGTSEAKEEERLMRSLQRQPGHGAAAVRKGSSAAAPVVAAPAPTVASTTATVSGWRERRSTMEKERAEQQQRELQLRQANAGRNGEVVSESIVGDTGIGLSESEVADLESSRVERHFKSSMDAAVLLEPTEKKFHFSAALDRDWSLAPFDEARFVRRLLDEINALRADPPAWCATLNEFRACFADKRYESPTQSQVKTETDEGVAAVQLASDVLAKLSPLPPLAVAHGLSLACATFTATQTGELSAPTGAKARRELHGLSSAYVELLNVGGASPKEVVLQWLVADGSEARKSRKALLNPAATHIGASAVRNRTCFQVTLCAVAENFAARK
jgi:uncharacterized protein YkwD